MDTPSLGYLLAHPDAVGIASLRPLAFLLASAMPVFFLWRQHAGYRASTLRAAAFVVLVAALAGLQLTARLPSDRLTLVAAVDVSESVDAVGLEWQRQYIEQVVGALSPGDELAVLTFANDVKLVRPPGAPEPLSNLPLPAARTATNLRRAIDSAMALFTTDGQRRLLILTDGNETRGNSRRQLAWLRTANVRVDAAIPPQGHEPDVRVDKLIAPPIVGEDSVISVRVVAYNTGGVQPAVLSLFLDGRITESSAVEVQPGLNTLDLPCRLTGQGSHLLSAHLAIDNDGKPGNNERQVGITVRGKTRVLLITPHRHSPLALALERKGVDTEARTPEQMPRSVWELLPYHGVILEDVTAADMGPAELERLERYVRDYGGGLILAGGGSTFGDVHFADTPLERLLPVTLEPHRPRRGAREPMALFLVIDRSNSMGYNSRIGALRDGEKLRYAKEAALAVVRQLKDQDLVGVVAFDSQPREISPLQPLRENRSRLEELIPQLVENGGTDFYDALVSARQQLAGSRVGRRHVVLLTDGDTNRAALEEYRSLIKDLTLAQISVTTIRIGDNTVNLKLLQDISRGTGGEFHHVENAEMLPDLMLRDATRALTPLSRRNEDFYPQLGSRSQLLRGIEERRIPPLIDYAYARPKDGADIPLYVTRLERGDPLLAVWRYGLGRVAAFTASPSDDAEQWLGWSAFPKFWSQLARWTAREHRESEYAIDARRSDGITELTVRTFGPGTDDGVLLARLHVSPDDVREVGLAPREPRLFSAALRNLPGGRFPLTIIKRGSDEEVFQHTELVTMPAVDQEPQKEHYRTTPNLALLTYLTENTGGMLNPTARELVERPRGARLARYPLDHLLLPLAMFLFLGDVAVRRLRLESSLPQSCDQAGADR